MQFKRQIHFSYVKSNQHLCFPFGVSQHLFKPTLRRAERSMVSAMCGVKLVNKRNTEELMNMLKLKEADDKLARENGVRWYGHVFRRPEEDVLMKAMVYEVDGKRKQGRPRIKWKEQVKGNMRRIVLRKKDAADRYRWRKGVKQVAKAMGCIRSLQSLGIKPD